MTLVIDDFAHGSPHGSADGSGWSVFTDRVMGGISEARGGIEVVQGQRALRLTGRVSLERNGGFVQMARTVGDARHACDARGYAGLSLTVCGTPGTYFVHLRTADVRAPWQYYGVALPVREDWQEVHLPWRAFTPTAFATPLDVSRLLRIGVVAGTKAFDADVALSRLAFVDDVR